MSPDRAPVTFGPRQLVAASASAPVSAQIQEDTPVWRIDRTHSELTFRIRHLVSRVSGDFADWGGTLVVDPANQADGSVEGPFAM